MGWFSRIRSAERGAGRTGGASAEGAAEGDDRLAADKVRILLDTISELISTVDHEAVLTSIVDKAIAAVGAERGILFLFDDESEPAAGDGASRRLRVKVARDRAGRDLKAPILYSTTVTRRVADEGLPTCWKVSSHEEAADLSRSIVDMKLRAVMCVTLRVSSRAFGLIYVDSRVNQREFTPADLRFFDALAGALAIAIENARLVEQALDAERMKQQIRIARRIQEGLLPRDPRGLRGIELAGRAVPAEDALGDYYDFVPLAGGRMLVAIGDVAGHGLGPALLMSSARAVLHSAAHGAARGGFDLAEALATVNDRLAADSDGAVFMSLFAAVLDPGGRSFTYANAGHTPPMLLKKGGGALTLAATGVALGVEEGQVCEVRGPLRLEPGDLLVLATDGILEARQGDDFFGRERLERAARAHAALPPRELIDALHREALAFAGKPLDDDVTLVVARAQDREDGDG